MWGLRKAVGGANFQRMCSGALAATMPVCPASSSVVQKPQSSCGATAPRRWHAVSPPQPEQPKQPALELQQLLPAPDLCRIPWPTTIKHRLPPGAPFYPPPCPPQVARLPPITRCAHVAGLVLDCECHWTSSSPPTLAARSCASTYGRRVEQRIPNPPTSRRARCIHSATPKRQSPARASCNRARRLLADGDRRHAGMHRTLRST